MPPDTERRSTILVVDDDPEVLRAVSRILRHEGHQVLEAADGFTAVELGWRHRPELVVLDYMLPGMNGTMILSALRNVLRDETPPAVLLTGAGDEQGRALEMGAVVGLSKPFRVADLIGTVDHFLARARADAS
jgi:two-component system alkaline phosphatase synthesis response regulator PhoP